MGPACLLIRRFQSPIRRIHQRRNLLTLAIESSCDDSCVALLEKHKNGSATLHFNGKITSDNRSYGGIYPIVASESHQKNIAALANDALLRRPVAGDGKDKMIIDFITVTRGPGMRAGLMTGMDTAKGLAVALQIPIIGVNHMQAHALTPRLDSALNAHEPEVSKGDISMEKASISPEPSFPFLTLLVSGGHTMLVHSKALCDHEILSDTSDMAIGDVIDKCARNILPASIIDAAPNVMYGPLLEEFAFSGCSPQQDHSRLYPYPWKMNAPSSSNLKNQFSYSGIGSTVKRIMEMNPKMDIYERQVLGMETMRVAFEHLASRVFLAFKRDEVKNIKTLVVSGGVASNKYLKTVLRDALDCKNHKDVQLIFPPSHFCTDNAAMIAWAGMEMYEAGWESKMTMMALKKWSVDPNADDGGILGVQGWLQTHVV